LFPISSSIEKVKVREAEDAGTRRWQIGAVRVTQVIESRGANPPSFLFAGLTAERVQSHAWLRPHFAHADGRLFASIHCFVVESQGRRIVVDTCVGNDKARSTAMWNQLHGPFLDDLARAGFPAASIDVVLCTHMHTDHVGWNTRLAGERWVPTFANARYLFSRAEYEHWVGAGDDEELQVLADSVRPIVEVGLADWVASDHVLTGEVRLEPTPGHTPGHVSVRLRSRGSEAVITGDLMHHPIQCCEPRVGSRFDVDSQAAYEIRLRFLREQADRNVLVLGTHFAAPTAGWIASAGDAWEFAVRPPESAAAGPRDRSPRR
jgi:glyoxylase-like metal-dependent hydrolase (beta-lactamase superfamily II)